MKTLALIHTSATLVPVFQQLTAAHLPGVEVFNIADDSLIKDVIRRNQLTPLTADRVGRYVQSAQDAGADFIMVTCSSIGRAVEAAAANARVPVLRVDQPMADEAVRAGSRIGVVATLPTTLDPTADLIRRRAALSGRDITLTERLCEGAFAALMNGDADTHDDAVSAALRQLAVECDVIVLAQASMARVAEAVQVAVPVLSSPGTAVRHLAAIHTGAAG
jgi:aspartate/glutamate racemase